MAAKKKVPTRSAKARKPAAKAAKQAARTAKPAARSAARKAPRKAPAKPKVAKAAPKAHAKSAPAARKTAKPAAPKTAAAKAKKPAARKQAPVEAVVTATAAAAPAVSQAPRGPRAVAMPAKARQIAVPSDDDEGYEPEDRHNLLLGPRNVTPYRERKGEQYMGKEQLAHFRNILESWKQDLMEEVDRTMTHMKDEAANPPDPNDRATLESEFALELRTRDRERKLIRKIEEALKRIEDGSYGYCLETGEPIGIKRLEARPVATLCIEAQERRERREKQYGDRDDWYR